MNGLKNQTNIPITDLRIALDCDHLTSLGIFESLNSIDLEVHFHKGIRIYSNEFFPCELMNSNTIPNIKKISVGNSPNLREQ